MSFNKENFYESGNSEEAFFKRANPLANGANAEILKVQECGSCDIELNVEIETVGDITTLTFNAPTSSYTDITVFTVQVTDGQGNFVTVQSDGIESELNTAALNSAVQWRFTILIEKGELSPAIDCSCSKKFNFDYNPALGIEIDTRDIGIGVLRASATEGGTYNLTTVPAGAYPDGGTSEDFDFYIQNVGVNALRVESISITGDVLSAAFDTTLAGSGTLFASNIRKIATTLDSSGAVGSYSGTVVFNYTNGSSQTITITYTLA
jgi:hypothetical protein